MKIIGIVLIILGCILGLFLLILLLPARVRVAVKEDKLYLWGGLGPLMIRVLPMREKKPKKQKTHRRHKALPEELPATQAASTGKKSQSGGKAPTVSTQPEAEGKSKFSMPRFSLEVISAYCRLAVDAIGQMKRHLIIRQLEIHAVIATEDAAVTAMAYGSAAAAVNLLLPVLEGNFRIRKEDISVDCDFGRNASAVDFTIELSAIVLPMLIIGIRVLRSIFKLNNEMKEKAVQV